jgi:Zn-dependent protease with chaperone function
VAADAPATGARPWGPYRLQLALGGAGLAASVLALAAGVSTVHVQPAGAHQTDVAGLAFTYPTVNAAAAVLMALALLGAVVLLVAVLAAVRQVRAHRRLIRALPVTGALPGHPSVVVVAADTPMAFCAGWLRPRVYVSTAVLDRLSPGELRAVLAHEQRHGALRDPLRLAIGRVLCTALFFLPVLRPLHDRYADEAELTADAAALAASGGATGPLASAMLALATTPGGGVVGISPERVDVLLGHPPQSWRTPRLLLLAALTSIAAIVTLAWRASGSAHAQATLNLPIASSQPCVLVLALVPVLACLAAVVVRRPTLAPGRRTPAA